MEKERFEKIPSDADRLEAAKRLGRPPSFGMIQSIPPGAPHVDIALDKALRRGIAQQMRALADVLDPPEVDR